MQYQDGRYDAVAREFRGFRRVVRATSEGSTAAPTLDRHGLRSGRADQRPHPAGRYLRRRRRRRAARDQHVGHAQRRARPDADLAGGSRAARDLDLGGVPLFRTTVSDPPDEYGNVTHSYSAGLFDADRVETYTTYATPQSGSQVHDKPSQVRVTDAARRRRAEMVLLRRQRRRRPRGQRRRSAGNLVRVRARLSPTVANGPQTRMTYDASGNLARRRPTTTAASPRRATTATRCIRLAVTDPLGHVTTTEVDYRWGQPGRIVDPNGAETYFTYDVAGRPRLRGAPRRLRQPVARPPRPTTSPPRRRSCRGWRRRRVRTARIRR